MIGAELAAPSLRMLGPQRPELTPEQQQLILAAAGEIIRATVLGESPVHADPTFAGSADYVVSGSFVSLKRGRHLRSCCGGLLDPPVTLTKALHDAAFRTAVDDARFPPVSPVELEHLDMEVWILYNPAAVTARGDDRVAAVVVGGKHGLVVARGQARGLLLPGVAADHNWDAKRFLEQVCVKAGLHPSLWKDDATSLMTFEGLPIRGRIKDTLAEANLSAPGWFFDSEELAAFADFCRANIALLLAGATPNYYLFGAADGQVSGAVLVVRRKGSTDGLNFSQLSTRPGVPLQATLFSLSQAAAQALTAQGATADNLDSLEIGLAILTDPAMHGTVADPHLGGIDPRARALLVMERAKAGMVFDPTATPGNLLVEAARQARVRTPAAASVLSLATLATVQPVALSTAPRATPGPAIRPAAVAGRFYPGEAEELFRLVDTMLDGDAVAAPWPAAMLPHAGLIYSGRIAAQVLKRLRIPETIIIIGPKHTPHGMEWAVAPHQAWSIPGRLVHSDPELARELTRAIPGLELDASAHQGEHGIEVELPFIARLAPSARVVGVAVGHGDLESCRQFATGLAEVLRERKDRPLLLISSDMNHFATDEENRRLDELALAALEGLDPEEVYETVTGNGISMCGLLPAVIVLETLRQLGDLRKCERVGYATTADVTGDTSRVVGYAGMLFGS
jgi:AmmeMemoRadiSam system protein B/AmmeMemoRadiSam system protein A